MRSASNSRRRCAVPACSASCFGPTHRVGRDRLRDALDLHGTALLAADVVLHQRVGLERDEHAARRRFVLEPRREVHRAAHHRVVHAVFAAEIADGAIAGVNADPAAQRRFDAGYCAIPRPARRRAAAWQSPFRRRPAHPPSRPSVTGSPKNMTMASPTYLSIVAPYWSAIFDISVR